MKILLWLRIIRPQTLFASLCPVVVALLAMTDKVASWSVATITIICALALQVLSNLINDYYDYKRGTDKKGRAGFKRALAEGEVSTNAMLTACLITLGVCLICGAYLIYIGGWVILAIGLTALLFAWLYTATSHSLSYLGIADIFVFLYYGVIASLGTYFLQTGEFSWRIFYAGGVCGLISMCVLFINNIRDLESDRLAGKRTLPVRFGKNVAIGMMYVIALLTPVMAYAAFGWSLPVLIVFPVLSIVRVVSKAEGVKFNICLLATGLTNLLYTILVAYETLS